MTAKGCVDCGRRADGERCVPCYNAQLLAGPGRNRRSSIYSLRVPSADPESVLDQLVGRMYSRGRGVLDQHTRTEDGVTYAAIGFRAADDAAAVALARELGLLPPYTIITGYGAHRRTV